MAYKHRQLAEKATAGGGQLTLSRRELKRGLPPHFPSRLCRSSQFDGIGKFCSSSLTYYPGQDPISFTARGSNPPQTHYFRARVRRRATKTIGEHPHCSVTNTEFETIGWASSFAEGASSAIRVHGTAAVQRDGCYCSRVVNAKGTIRAGLYEKGDRSGCQRSILRVVV